MKWNKRKMNKVFLTLPTLLTAITIAPTLAIIGSKVVENGNNINNSTINNDTTTSGEIKPLVPSVANMYNPKLSSRNGPIVFWKEKITSLDWFGAERWSIDVTTIQMDGIYPLKDNGNNGTSWIRYWLNYELDKTNDILYILSNAKRNAYQYIVSIDVKTGKTLKCYKTAEKLVNSNVTANAFFRIKVLSNGNVAFFGVQGHIADNKDIIDIVDIKKGTTTRYDGNITNDIAPRPTATDVGHNYSLSNNATFNLIPIGVNRNLLCIYNLTSQGNTENDAGAQKGTSDVWFILVDDHFNTIQTASSEWQKARLVTKAITNTRNSKIVPQGDYHVLLDGRVVTVIYDKLVIIDPMNLDDPKLTISELEHDKWIESWSFDSNETLFFKERNGTVIKQVKLDPNRNNTEKPNHVISPYYNLSESPIQEIKDTSNTLILYNVYGYIGQIMLINSQFQIGISDSLYPKNEDDIQEKKYGLAVAITNNKEALGQGDTKGLLNTNKAFLKSADFNITDEILSKKLPSEITKDDITFLNSSFLTTNNTKNENGTLKYEPFVKNTIDDNNKTLKLTLNLDQIPWFVTDGKMPSTIAPLTITKDFNFNVDINNRFSWKPVDQDDYDFKNTLPTKMTVADIERISPLVSTLTSQRLTINNKVYPRTEYKILEQNDDTGKIKIQATYEYLPMELRADISNLKSHILEKEYTIFKNSSLKKLMFVGDKESNVANIPALKEIKESNVLPSSFLNATKQEYLKFIDTNNSFGYPLEKMNISVTANDTNGTLTIKIDPTKYDSSLSVLTKEFTGLNKTNSYTLRFNESYLSFKKLDYLPSEVNEEIFYKNFLTFNGFDSSDFELYLYPNDVTGQLTANIILMGNYPSGPTINTDFKKENNQWIARRTFSGFQTINDFNKEYQLTFKKDNSSSLSNLQKLTPSEIQNALSSNDGLKISNKNYKNKKQLIGLFIETKGNKLANIDIENSDDVQVEMYINNGGGEITWKITYNKLEGYSNPITFLQTIGGFAKGNDVPTVDVLTLKNNNQLQLSKPEYFKQLPSQIKSILDLDQQSIKEFFLNEPTGGYKIAFEQNKFKLAIIADDNTGRLNVKIIFEKENTGIKNESLLEYSQMYFGFNYQ